MSTIFTLDDSIELIKLSDELQSKLDDIGTLITELYKYDNDLQDKGFVMALEKLKNETVLMYESYDYIHQLGHKIHDLCCEYDDFKFDKE